MVLSVYFCMTKTDLTNMIRNVESNLAVHYIIAQSYPTREVESYNSMEDYEMLGINTSGNLLKEFFLVMEKDASLYMREVHLLAGGTNYHVEQTGNMDSVILCPGGFYEDDFLICGFVKTLSKTDIAQKMMKTFQKYIKKECKKKAGRFYIGKDAETYYGKRRFITMSIGQPEEYDLKL